MRFLLLFPFLASCATVNVTYTPDCNDTSGWVVLRLMARQDGAMLHLYEPNMGWHAVTLMEGGKVSRTLVKRAEGFCLETDGVNRNEWGILTCQRMVRSNSGCADFDKAVEDYYDGTEYASWLDDLL